MKKIPVIITVALLAFSMLISCDGGINPTKLEMPERYRNLKVALWGEKEIIFDENGFIPALNEPGVKNLRWEESAVDDVDYLIGFDTAEANWTVYMTYGGPGAAELNNAVKFTVFKSTETWNHDHYAERIGNDAPEWIRDTKWEAPNGATVSFDVTGRPVFSAGSDTRSAIINIDGDTVTYAIDDGPWLTMAPTTTGAKAHTKRGSHETDNDMTLVNTDGPEWMKDLHLADISKEEGSMALNFDGRGRLILEGSGWRYEETSLDEQQWTFDMDRVNEDNELVESRTYMIINDNEYGKTVSIETQTYTPGNAIPDSSSTVSRRKFFNIAATGPACLNGTVWQSEERGKTLHFDSTGLYAAEGKHYRTGINYCYTNEGDTYAGFTRYVFPEGTKESIEIVYNGGKLWERVKQPDIAPEPYINYEYTLTVAP